MVKIIMSGCSGRMGRVITELVKEDSEAEIVAGIDIIDDGTLGYPVFKSAGDIDVDADVVIDFSNAKAVDALLDYAVAKQVPVVLCTTGLSEEQLAKVENWISTIAVKMNETKEN